MHRYGFWPAFVLALAAGACAGAASQIVFSAESRYDQERAIQQVRIEHATLRIELDAVRRELSRRPVPPANGPLPSDPDKIPVQALPTNPKE